MRGVVVVLSEEGDAGTVVLPRWDDEVIEAQSRTPLAVPAAENMAYVIYTSGSTGQPKGVVLPQAAVCNFLSSMKRQPGITASDRLLAVTTLSFDIAVLELFLPLITGARVVLAQREDAIDGESLSKLIADEGITFMQATPTTWHLLLEASWKAPVGFKALCGGEPLPPSLAEPLLAQGMTLWNMYGPTETTVWSTVAAITDHRQKPLIELDLLLWFLFAPVAQGETADAGANDLDILLLSA